jgi:signal transduction histidine kinase
LDAPAAPRPYDRRVPPIRFLRGSIVVDAGLAVTLAAASYYGAEFFLRDGADAAKLIPVYGSQAALEGHRIQWWLCAGAAAAAVLIRRRWPSPAFLLAAAAIAVLVSDKNVPLPALALAVPITLYGLASVTPSRRWGILALAFAVVAAWLLTAHRLVWVGPGLDALLDASVRESALAAAAVPALLLGIAWAAGDNARTRRLHLATLEQHAGDLRRERDQRDQLAIAAERARITRELHDVVAHGIAVIVIQAQGAAAALHRHPERTAAALGHIIATGRGSLAEMRYLLGLARDDPGDVPQLQPQPGIGSLRSLFDQVRDAGTPVSLRIEGEPVPLPAGVDLTAYRIVQEGLTNTLKHAGAGAQATVRLAFAETQLDVEVADDGRGPPRPGIDGNGLRGIAERVSAVGGTVDSGPRAGGGFAIRALLPIEHATGTPIAAQASK